MKINDKTACLSAVDSILLLANLRKLDLKPFLTENAFNRLRGRLICQYGVDFAGPPDKTAYDLLSCRGGDLELWPSPREIERAA